MHPLLWLGYEIETVDRDFSRLDSTVRNYALSEFLLLPCMNRTCFRAYLLRVWKSTFRIHDVRYMYGKPPVRIHIPPVVPVSL